jgi:hypothetical protein
MADEDAALTDESLWWGPDAPDDAPLPPASFDEPVAWPETIEWPVAAADGDVVAGSAISPPLPQVDDGLLFDSEPRSSVDPGPQGDPVPVGAVQADPVPVDAIQADDVPVDAMAPLPVAAADDAGNDFRLEPLAESIWDADPDPLVPPAPTEAAGAAGVPAAAATGRLTGVGPRPATPARPFYAEAEHRRPGTFGGRFQLRSAKGVMVGLAAVAALALFAIALSNRNGSNVGSTASPNPGAAGNIVTQGLPSSTVPGTSTTVAAPPSSVAATDAPAPPADATGAGAGAGTPAAGGGTPRPATPATPATTAPARAAAPAGQGGGSAPSTADTPAPAPAPTPTPVTQPPATSPPDTVPDTTPPTAPPHTRPSIPEITVPSIPVTTTVASDVPTITTRPKRPD